MSWNSIADNQLVSRDNLQNGIDIGALYYKSAITGPGNECVTCADVTAFTWTNMSGYDPNYLPTRYTIYAASFVDSWTVTVYMKWGASNANNDYEGYYKIGAGGPWTYIGLITSDVCAQYSTYYVPKGATIYFNINEQGGCSYYNAANSTSCPSNSQSYCVNSPYSITPTSNTSVALTIYIDSNGFAVPCC